LQPLYHAIGSIARKKYTNSNLRKAQNRAAASSLFARSGNFPTMKANFVATAPHSPWPLPLGTASAFGSANRRRITGTIIPRPEFASAAGGVQLGETPEKIQGIHLEAQNELQPPLSCRKQRRCDFFAGISIYYASWAFWFSLA